MPVDPTPESQNDQLKPKKLPELMPEVIDLVSTNSAVMINLDQTPIENGPQSPHQTSPTFLPAEVEAMSPVYSAFRMSEYVLNSVLMQPAQYDPELLHSEDENTNTNDGDNNN